MTLKLKATFWQFLSRAVLWAIISIVTLGIGSIWVAYDSTKWFIEHIEVSKK